VAEDVRINFKGDANDAVRAAESLAKALNRVHFTAKETTQALKGSTDLKTDKAVSEAKKLDRALDKTTSESDRLKKSLGGIATAAKAAAAAGAVALGGLAVGAKKSIDAAVDLGEQLNKAKVVFRGAEQTVIEFSQTTASSLGISQRAALEAAGTFGNMLVPMGFARGEAAKMSVAMVQLAADMASFNNASPEETLQAIRSGLAGETEPLRRFGVFLNQARIEAEALRLGLIKKGEALTAAGKAAATYSLIMKDTKDAQGDFGRTSESLANQQRILKARLEDAAAAIGAKLIPAASAALGAFGALIPKLQEFGTKAAEVVGPAFEKMGARIAASLQSIGPQIQRALPAFADFGGRAATAILAGFADLAELAGRSVGRIAEVIAKHEGTLRTVGDRLARAFSGAWDGTKEILEVFFVQVLPRAIDITIRALDKLTAAAEFVADAVGGWDNAFQLVLGGLLAAKIGSLAVTITVQLVTSLRAAQASAAAAGTQMTLMGTAGSLALARIRLALISTGVGALLVGIGLAAVYVIENWDKVKSWFSRFGSWLGEFFSDLWRDIKQKALEAALVVLEPFSHLPGKLGGWARDAKDAANKQLREIKVERDWDKHGADAGGRWASAFLRQAEQQIASGQLSPGAALAPDNKNPDPVTVKPSAGAGAHPDSKGGRRTGGSTGAGQVTVNPRRLPKGQGRPSTKPHVVAFVRKISEIYGAPLTIWDNSTHSETTVDGNRSDHADGNAADIPATGASLTRLGQAALIAAGADEAWARKQTGGVYNVGGVNILFNTDQGGNHWNHLHVGLKAPVEDNDKGGGTTTVSGEKFDVSGTGAETSTPGKTKAKSAAKSLAEGVAAVKKDVQVALKSVNLKDLPEARSLKADLEKVLADLADGVANPAALAKLKAKAKELKEALKNAVAADEIRDSIATARRGVSAALKEGLIDERTALDAAAAYRRAEDLIRRAFAKKSPGGRFVTKEELAEIKAEFKSAGDAIRKSLEDLAQTMTASVDAFVESGLIGPATASKITQGVARFSDLVARSMRDGLLSPTEVKKLDAVWSDVSKTLVRGMVPALADAKKQFKDLLGKGFIDEETAAGIQSAFALIAKLTKDGIQKADLKPLADAWTTISSGVSEAAASLEKALPKIRSFKKTWDEAFGDGLFSDAELADLKESAGKIGGTIGQGLQEAIDEVTAARGEFRSALESFKNQVSEVFREKVVLRFQVAIDFADELSRVAEVEDTLERASATWGDVVAAGASRVTDAVEAVLETERRVLAATVAYGKEATAENKARLEQAIKDRQNARVALQRISESELTEQERAALEAGQRLVTAVQDKNRMVLDEERRGWEKATTETLAKVNAYIDEQIGAFERGEQSWETTLGNIRQKLIDSGVDAETAGGVMANAVTSAMTAAASAMTTAMQSLVAAINALVSALGLSTGTAETLAERAERAAARAIASYKKALMAAGASEAEAAQVAANIASIPEVPVPQQNPHQGGRPVPMSDGGPVGGWPRWPTDGVPILAAGGEHVLNPPQIDLLRSALASAGPAALGQLSGAAHGRWKHLRRFLPSSRSQAVVPRALMARIGALGAGPGGGGLAVSVTVPVQVDAGLLAHEREVGEAIARVASGAIRDELIRLGGRNLDIFGGHA
jgi:hypothetical protein